MMFINKIAEQPNLNPQKMSSYINTFLKTELTCIPKLLSGYLGNYYNNALCNGATWVFLLWYLIHALFDKTCNAFLKKLRYREYVRTRLKSSLWYLGFFGTALVYCGATLTQNEVELFNFKRMHVVSSNSLPMQVMLGYTLICTFYIHSALWEGLSEGNVMKMCSFMFLFAFMVSSYILRVVEISFTLTALISVAQVTLEFTRCCFMASVQDTFASKVSAGFTYFATFLVYLAIHVIVIPLTFIIPLGIKIVSDYPNILLVFLFFNLCMWFVTEFYNSVVVKLVNHWLYHKQLKKKQDLSESTEMIDNFDYLNWCSSTLLECSLFKPRDDDSYNLMILREEIKARKNKMLSMRKPKNMFLQTLKCMVAIKRKLSERQKSSDSSDSDSENGDLKAIDNTDDEVAEDAQSDEDSDNEESDSQEEGTEQKDDQTETKDEETKETSTSGLDTDSPGDVHIETMKKQKVGEESTQQDTDSGGRDSDLRVDSDSSTETVKEAAIVKESTAPKQTIAGEQAPKLETDSSKEDIVDKVDDSHTMKNSNNTSLHQSTIALKDSITSNHTSENQEAQNQDDIEFSKE